MVGLRGKRIVSLARSMRITHKEHVEPLGQEEYETAVEEFVQGATKEEVIEVVAAIEKAVEQGDALGGFTVYPLLIAFGKRFGGSPELYLEIYREMRGSGGSAIRLAPDYLRKAYEADPNNYYVLWKMFLSWGYIYSVHGPTFPPELLLSANEVEHERQCLKRILKIAPDDKLARTALEWVEQHNRPYTQSPHVPIPKSDMSAIRRPTHRRSLHEILEDADP